MVSGGCVEIGRNPGRAHAGRPGELHSIEIGDEAIVVAHAELDEIDRVQILDVDELADVDAQVAGLIGKNLLHVIENRVVVDVTVAEARGADLPFEIVEFKSVPVIRRGFGSLEVGVFLSLVNQEDRLGELLGIEVVDRGDLQKGQDNREREQAAVSGHANHKIECPRME